MGYNISSDGYLSAWFMSIIQEGQPYGSESDSDLSLPEVSLYDHEEFKPTTILQQKGTDPVIVMEQTDIWTAAATFVQEMEVPDDQDAGRCKL